MRVFEFDADGRLRALSMAGHAIHVEGQWTLHDVRRTEFGEGSAASTKQDSKAWDSQLDPGLLASSIVKAQYMPLATVAPRGAGTAMLWLIEASSAQRNGALVTASACATRKSRALSTGAASAKSSRASFEVLPGSGAASADSDFASAGSSSMRACIVMCLSSRSR